MPRKRKEQPSNYDKAFPTAMRILMGQNGTTQNDLADYLKKTRQAVSYYCDGSSYPDWETIVKIADYFNTSTDYLLGRTDDPHRYPSAVDDLGLSVKAVAAIERMEAYDTPTGQMLFRNASGHAMDVLNCLLESQYFKEIFGNLLLCYDSYFVDAAGTGMDADDCETEEELRNNGCVVLAGTDAGKFYASEAANALKDFACAEIPTIVVSRQKSN